MDATEDAKLQVPSTQSVGERVLIVEDDASTREGLAELVQTWGFQTEEAADGEEGLRKVTSFRPAIIVSDMERMHWLSNRGQGIGEISPGVHGLSNHLLDTPWPKVVRGKQRVSALLAAKEPELIRGLFDVLADRTAAPDAELPDTSVGLQRERELSPAFIAAERYGTRASTVLLVSRESEAVCVERRFGAKGVPQGEAVRRFEVYRRGSGRKTKAAGQDV